MTGWIIFGSILLVLIFAFTRPVKITAVYDSNPELRIKILCFTIVKIPQDEKAKRKKAAKARKKAEKERRKAEKERKKAEKLAAKEAKKNGVTKVTAAAESADNTENAETAADSAKSGKAKKEKPPKKKFKMPDLDLDMIRDYIASASPPIKRLFKKIRIRDVYIDWVVGSNDAAVTALKYGGVCAALYPAFEWIDTYFDAKIQEINIEADFSAEKDDIFAYGSLQLRICTAIGCVLWLAVRLLKTYLKYNPATGSKHKPKTRPVRVKAR